MKSIPRLREILVDNANFCINTDGAFDPPDWLVSVCIPVIAENVPDFFQDAYNGDADFERSIIEFTLDATSVTSAAALMHSWRILSASAKWYMQHYADDVLEYINRPETQFND